MEDIKQILVVSRSTKECKKAFHYGVFLAKSTGAKLSILHIEDEPMFQWGDFPYSGLVDFQKEYRAMLQEAKKDIDKMIAKEKAEGLNINEMVESGEALSQVMDMVKKEKTDLIIMAAHDEGRIEHMFYGRLNHEIVRRLPCSVFFVKGK